MSAEKRTVGNRWSRTRTSFDSGDEMLTRQEQLDQVDINNIVARYATTGMWDHINPVEPVFGDISEANDLEQALTLVAEANSEFEELPSSVRNAAGNDPVRFREMLADPAGAYALQEAGLRFTRELPEPIAPAVQADPPTDSQGSPPAPPSEPSDAS